jgi:hypothetical protein
MAAFSTKGLTVWLQKKPGTSPVAINVTSVTNAKPAVATVGPADATKFKVGDIVLVKGTNLKSLDGKTFAVGTITSNSFPLQGSDASGETAAAAVGNLTNYTTADMVEFCVSSIEYAQAAAQAINVGTTCDPTAQIAGEPQAGTVSVTGFQDYTKEGFLEFMRAVNDQLPRILQIKLPVEATTSGQGMIIFPAATATGFGETFTVGQAAGFTGEFTLGTKPLFVTV